MAECPPELRSSQLLRFERIIPISAHELRNIDEAKRAIRDVLDESAERELADPKANEPVVSPAAFQPSVSSRRKH